MKHKPKNEITVTDSIFPGTRLSKRLLFTFTGQRYQYEVTATYYFKQSKDGNWDAGHYHSRTTQFAVVDPIFFDFKHRHLLHKDVAEELMKNVPPEHRQNGVIKVTRIDYLGRW